jgi:hypothetical protein
MKTDSGARDRSAKSTLRVHDLFKGAGQADLKALGKPRAAQQSGCHVAGSIAFRS